MECFGTTDFDNNGQLITLSAIIISGLHCTMEIYDCCFDKSLHSVLMMIHLCLHDTVRHRIFY